MQAKSHTWAAEGGFLGRQEGLGGVESKERPKGFAKNQQIVTLDEQGDDGSLHPLVHEEDYPGSHKDNVEPNITKGFTLKAMGFVKFQYQINHQQHFSSRQQTTERI